MPGLGKRGEGSVEIALFVQTHGRRRLVENQYAAAIGVWPRYFPDGPGNRDQRAIS